MSRVALFDAFVFVIITSMVQVSLGFSFKPFKAAGNSPDNPAHYGTKPDHSGMVQAFDFEAFKAAGNSPDNPAARRQSQQDITDQMSSLIESITQSYAEAAEEKKREMAQLTQPKAGDSPETRKVRKLMKKLTTFDEIKNAFKLDDKAFKRHRRDVEEEEQQQQQPQVKLKITTTTTTTTTSTMTTTTEDEGRRCMILFSIQGINANLFVRRRLALRHDIDIF